MIPGHIRERPLGMRYYTSSTPGIGGRLKSSPADFRVTEVPGVDPEPVSADPGDYPYLVVEVTATDRDTHDLLAILAEEMGLHPDQLAISGTKDANAVTTQWLTLHKVHPNELVEIPDVDLKVVGRLGSQLDFGDHAGNAFEIVVRSSNAPERIDRITDELASGDGSVVVPNFFGHQRFGIRRAITHDIGRLVLQGAIRAAVLTYLTTTSQHEPERTQQARAEIEAALEADDQTSALEATPGYLHHERRMLEVLVNEGQTAYETAFGALPWSLQRLFIHAVQSQAFNEILSERMRRGMPIDRPVEGDAICFFDDDGSIDPDTMQPVSERRLETARRHCDRGRAVIVGPLVGRETELLEGEPGAIQSAVLEGLGLDLDTFGSNPISDIEGSWRPFSVRTEMAVSLDPPMFSFSLPPGSYATVVLREYLKCDPLRMV